MLRVLIENLPPDSARHRAANDGVLWTDTHSLLNLLEFRLRENSAVTIQAAGGKPKRQKFNPTPWKKPDNVIGNTKGATPEQVIAYLDSLKPKPQ